MLQDSDNPAPPAVSGFAALSGTPAAGSSELAAIPVFSDAALVAALIGCARGERQATVELVAHLAEFDTRRLYLGAGFSSLFTYCCEVLRLSEHESYNRIEAARVVRKFPLILHLLRDGRFNLTTVRLLAPHLTPQNHEELIAGAVDRAKREVEKLVARCFPLPEVPPSIRKLPAPRGHTVLRSGAVPAGMGVVQKFLGPRDPGGSAGHEGATVLPHSDENQGAAGRFEADGRGQADGRDEAAGHPTAPPRAVGQPDLQDSLPTPAGPVTPQAMSAPAWRSPGAPVPAVRPGTVKPLAPNRYQITFTASEATREKLRLAQDLLRHAVPTGDTAEIVDRALTLLLQDLARKKLAATERPRAAEGSPRPTTPGSRHIPAAVKRSVWLRDSGRCVFVGQAGRRCTERGFLEFHHLKPYAAGGEATVANLELRCRPHNAYESDVFFVE